MKLTKKKAKSLPRVTAYATAKRVKDCIRLLACSDKSHSSYRMNDLMKFFNARRNAYHTDPRMLDDVIYTPYGYEVSSSRDNRTSHPPTGDLLGITELKDAVSDRTEDTKQKRKSSKFDITANEAEIFMFSYGTVVIWGLTEPQEKRFLSSM